LAFIYSPTTEAIAQTQLIQEKARFLRNEALLSPPNSLMDVEFYEKYCDYLFLEELYSYLIL